ncbi:SRPBCC family protein [Tunturibacter empetritectus]
MARDIALNDLARRDTTIHWPKGFDPATAAQFSHNELLIPAPCEHVFAQMANVTAWPEWFILVKDVRVEGPNKTPGLGRTLSLSIFNTPITAKITEWVPGKRLSWTPETVAPSESSHYHAWHFIPVEGGCRAVTEEVGVGPADKKLGTEGSFYMHRAHDLWLASLRYASE